MNRLDKALRIIEDEFDAFIVIGSIYNPSTGETHIKHINHGNAFAIEGMMQDANERRYQTVPLGDGDE